ncbi:MAG: glycerophosphodiester phosphodiesterase family protein [Eubacteriales bacterium]|nr:glycerophosphodiester phosphodiesterase family protein [Eubacteriales bacterium]
MIILILILLSLYILSIGTQKPKQNVQAFSPHLYTHRGYYDNQNFPCENTLAAFARSVEHGYGIELDIQYTRDRKIVVFHDISLQRLCGIDKRISECDYADIVRYTLPCGNKIPLFSEVLELVNGQVPLIVELKPFKDTIALVKEALDMLDAYNGSFCIECFNPLPIVWLRWNRPDVLRGQLSNGHFTPDYHTKGYQAVILKYLLTNLFAAPHFVSYTPPTDNNLSMYLLKRIYKPLLCAYTIKSPKELEEARAKGYTMLIFEGFAAK